MTEKIKKFKELKERLDYLYSVKESTNTISSSTKKEIMEIENKIRDLEKTLGILDIKSELEKINKEIIGNSRIEDTMNQLIPNQRKKTDSRKAFISSFRVFLIGTVAVTLIFGFPIASLIYTSIVGFIASLCIALVVKIKGPDDTILLIEALEKARSEKSKLLKSKKAYQNELEKAYSDPMFAKFYKKRDELNSSYADMELCNNETNDEIMSVEAEYNRLGLEIATELSSMSDKETLSSEDIASILPELKVILETRVEEKMANKLSLQ